jgi:phage terminase large subunit-like protein
VGVAKPTEDRLARRRRARAASATPKTGRDRRISRGERNCRWIEEHCRVPEGKLVGQPVRLRPWQRRIIKAIYDQGARRVIISFARKNGKTALAAMLLLLHLCGPEAKENSSLNSAAQSLEQAAILFRLASKMVRMSPDLDEFVRVREQSKELACDELGTLYKALSAEASTAYGLSPVFVVHDELGQVRGARSELYEALESGSAAHEDPLSIVISTQAPTDADLLSLLIDDALAKGDPRTLVFLFTADEALDPFSEKALKAANPAFGDFQNAAELRELAETAKRMPSREAGYRNLNLNQRVNLVNPFVSRSVWDANAGAVEEQCFAGDVTMAIDLSQRNDLTAVVEGADDAEGNTNLRAQFFTPLIGLADRSRRDRTPYDLWVKQGWITATPGASVDFDLVADYIIERRSQCRSLKVVADRWRLEELKSALARKGCDIEIEPFGQGFVSMAPALDAFEALLLNGKVRHGGNPVMRMCAANAIAVKDPAGNRKLDKSKASGRIDGIVAAVMCVGNRAKARAAAPPGYQIIVF